MLIRKKFKFEMAHIVRNAWSQRCSHSIHGHSFIVEVMFKGSGKKLDSAGMLIDFGIVKKYFNDFIDSFDHSTCLWQGRESPEIIKFFMNNFERVIVMPVNSSAEEQAKIFLQFANVVLAFVKLTHNEFVGSAIEVHSVRVHETATGYAEAFMTDIDNDFSNLEKIQFSRAIRNDWKNSFIKNYYEEK